MAGSYRHIADENNNFKGVEFLDNLGDAYEALSGSDKNKIEAAHLKYIKRVNGNVEYVRNMDFWKE